MSVTRLTWPDLKSSIPTGDGKRIVWEQLSPILQAKFIYLLDELKTNKDLLLKGADMIDTNSQLIDDIDNLIDEIKKHTATKKTEIDTKISDKLKELKPEPAGGSITKGFFQGEHGQIAKIDAVNISLSPHDELKLRLIYSTTTEQDNLVNLATSMDALSTELEGDLKAYDVSSTTQSGGTVWKRNGSSWSYNSGEQVQGDGKLEPYTFYLNPLTHQLYFFKFIGTYHKVTFSNRADFYEGHRNEVGYIRKAGTNFGYPYIALAGDSLVDRQTPVKIENYNKSTSEGLNINSHWSYLAENETNCFMLNLALGGSVLDTGAGEDSSIYNVLKNRILTLDPLPDIAMFDGGGNDLYGVSSSDINSRVTQMIAYYKKMISMCRSKGVEPVPLLLPSYGSSNNQKIAYRQMHNELRTYCNSNGVKYVDVYAKDPMTSKSYYVDDYHHTPAAHRIIADCVKEFLQTNGYV